MCSALMQNEFAYWNMSLHFAKIPDEHLRWERLLSLRETHKKDFE